jgi:hypothetical protein
VKISVEGREHRPIYLPRFLVPRERRHEGVSRHGNVPDACWREGGGEIPNTVSVRVPNVLINRINRTMYASSAKQGCQIDRPCPRLADTPALHPQIIACKINPRPSRFLIDILNFSKARNAYDASCNPHSSIDNEFLSWCINRTGVHATCKTCRTCNEGLKCNFLCRL